MKKLIIVLVGCLLLTGCGSSKKLDFAKIQKELDTLTVNGNLVFPDLRELSTEDLDNLYSIDSTLTEEIDFLVAEDSSNPDLYILVLPKKGKEEEIKKQIATYFESFELQADLYNPENAQKIKNRTEEKIGSYLVYIVSDYNEEVLKTIKK